MQTDTAPTVGRDAGLGTLPDLLPFCSTDETRPALMAPWNADPYTYATDGRILVRVALRPEWEQKTENHPQAPVWLVPSALKLFIGFPDCDDRCFVPLPALPSMEDKLPCRECNGSGAVLVTYPGGENDAVVCDSCEGEKLVPNWTRFRIGNREVAIHYAIKMARLPGLLVTLGRGTCDDPLAFIFDGGQGVLMPLRKSA